MAGLDLSFSPVTVLVGDNGSGTSTLIEALAVAAGFNAEGGGRNCASRRSPRTPTSTATSSCGGDSDRSGAGSCAPRRSTGWPATSPPTKRPAVRYASLFPALHDRSHGRSFLSLMESRFLQPGLDLMDEPESASSFQGQLQLLRLIRDGVDSGAPFVLATHSPILMRAEGAAIYELDEAGMHRTEHDDVTAVALWRRFLEQPEALLSVHYADED